MTTDLLFLQSCAPDYRKKFYDLLAQKYAKKYVLCAGDISPTLVKTDHSIPQLNLIKNHYFLNRKLLFQTGAFFKALMVPCLVTELTPRTLSSWILLCLRKLLGKKTVLWGHAWPRAGKGAKSDRLRHIMRLLADQIILYTQSQLCELREKMPHKKISYAANAIYLNNEMQPHDPDAPLGEDIIYVGRLHSDKKPLLLLQAFGKIYDQLPEMTNLVFVGSGAEQMALLKQQADEFGISDRVIFKGHISDYQTLKLLYHHAFVSVSPGYVGLSVTQTLGFGVGMIIARHEPHAPEVECAIEGENCLFFTENDADDLAQKIMLFHQSKKAWSQKKSKISSDVRALYSIEKMIAPFLEL